MSVTLTTRINRPSDVLNEAALSAANRELRPLPAAASTPVQRILAVEFRSTDGRSWRAIGGGATVAAAIAWARECCPGDTTWELVGWEDLYGE
jgi:hypothetical protein